MSEVSKDSDFIKALRDYFDLSKKEQYGKLQAIADLGDGSLRNYSVALKKIRGMLDRHVENEGKKNQVVTYTVIAGKQAEIVTLIDSHKHHEPIKEYCKAMWGITAEDPSLLQPNLDINIHDDEVKDGAIATKEKSKPLTKVSSKELADLTSPPTESTKLSSDDLSRLIENRVNIYKEAQRKRQQTTTFAVDLPAIANGKKLRWNAKFPELSFPHIIITESFGRKITLHILNHDVGECLTLRLATPSSKHPRNLFRITGTYPIKIPTTDC